MIMDGTEAAGILQKIHECPDDRYLNRHVRINVCAAGVDKWRDLGVVLMGQNAVPDLEVIKLSNCNDLESCCSKMFSLWRTRQPKASWRQLIEALKEVNLTRLACELEGMLIPSVGLSVEELTKLLLNIQSRLCEQKCLHQHNPVHRSEGHSRESAFSMGAQLQNMVLELIDYLNPRMKECRKYLKQCYLNRLNQKLSTRWPKLGDPSLCLDVSIVRAKCLSRRSVKDISECHYEEHAMGLLKDEVDICYVTISEVLSGGHKKVILIEGDPGCGKTTLTIQICKEWADNRLLTNDILIWVPLRYYKSVLSTNELFSKLGCPEVMEYAQQNNGDGLVFIFDGWDELPSDLQVSSFFRDIVFGKNRTFIHSTVMVTSRPSCSVELAEFVEGNETYYQILGFTPQNAELYIQKYFYDDLASAELLVSFLKGHVYLRRHFYIPITVAMMCFVCYHDGEVPNSLSRLYERFTILYIRSDACLKDKKFTSLCNVPEKTKPLFSKLCRTAFSMLRDKKLVFDEEDLGIAEKDLEVLDVNVEMEKYDGFGLLHVDNYTSALADVERSYSFIHRAVQELLAAIFILKTGNMSDVVDEHFHEGSYLSNVFPFLFGLASKEVVRSVVGKLAQIYNIWSNRHVMLSRVSLFNLILFCLFEAQDEILCCEFGKVFNDKKNVKFELSTLLDCHYAGYFLSVCGGKRLNVTVWCGFQKLDGFFEVFSKYLCATATEISSIEFESWCSIVLPHKGMKLFADMLSCQHQLISLYITGYTKYDAGCVAVLCQSLCKHNPQLTNLKLPLARLSIDDLDCIGSLIFKSKHLENIDMSECSLSEEMDFSLNLYNALSESKCLKELKLTIYDLPWSKAVGNAISVNCSLKYLCVKVVTDGNCLVPIVNGLSSNTSIRVFTVLHNNSIDMLGQCLEKCFTDNHSLKAVDFASPKFLMCIMNWSCVVVKSICVGLCTNSTLVTLDISGGCIDSEACDAVCTMLSVNTTLQHLFLNPCGMKKLGAVVMIDSCRGNDIITILSLVRWPPEIPSRHKEEERFQFSADQEIEHTLHQIQTVRQEKDKPLLNVYWNFDEYRAAKKELLSAHCTYRDPCYW